MDDVFDTGKFSTATHSADDSDIDNKLTNK